MKRKVLVLVLFAVIILSLGVVSASDAPTEKSTSPSVHYNITLNNTTAKATVNVSITNSETSEYTEWTLDWRIPENAELHSVTSQHGDSTYDRSGTTISIKSDGQRRSSETFYVTYTQNMTNQISNYEEISIMRLGLLGYDNTEASAEVNINGGTPINVFSYHEHNSIIENSAANITYFDSSLVHIAYQTEEPDMVTDKLTIYGESRFNETEFAEMYENAVISTGYTAEGATVPLIILSDDEYEELVGNSSGGMYMDGVVFVKKETVLETYTTVSHELVHAITHTRIGITPDWFDEGAAELAESIAIDRFGGQQETFDREYDLYQYHESDERWVYTEGFDSTNYFAYDYSEMRMKLYIKENGFAAYKEAYGNLVQADRTHFTPTQIESISGIEMKRVCDKETVSQTEQCADEVINYIPDYNTSESISKSSITTTEQPTTEEPTGTSPPTTEPPTKTPTTKPSGTPDNNPEPTKTEEQSTTIDETVLQLLAFTIVILSLVVSLLRR